jgi:uncharacterized protein
MPILAALGAILFLALIYGPSLWIRHVMSVHGEHRDDFPGTGGELARHLLDESGLKDVKVEQTAMGDHYDPDARVVRLSEAHFARRSIAAVAVAAHEVAHAVQHARGEASFERRMRLVRLAAPFQRIAMLILVAAPIIFIVVKAPVLLIGQLLLGFALMLTQLVAHAVTLPVEFDASFKKALPVLEQGQYLSQADMPAARRVLRAAALTYVSAALATLLNVLRWVRP